MRDCLTASLEAIVDSTTCKNLINSKVSETISFATIYNNRRIGDVWLAK